MALNPRRSHATSVNAQTLSLAGLIAIFAAFLGLVSSTGDLYGTVIVGGVMMAIAAVFFPVQLLWLAITGGMVISGFVRLYLPEFQIVSWLVAGVSYLLLAHVASDLFRAPTGLVRHRHVPGLVYLAFLFLALAAITTVLNRGGLAANIAGAKNYFQVWPLLFVLALVRWNERVLLAIPKVMLWIALLQLPLVLHQFIAIVPMRVGLGKGIVPVDVVAGTFGADRLGGGANSTLALFLIVVWTGVLAQWKYRLLSGSKLAFLSLLLLTPLFLNESKVSILYLAVAFAMLFREEFFRRPLFFIGGGCAFVILATGLLFSYAALKYNSQESDISTVIDTAIESNFGDRRAKWSKELNRASVYSFWLERHGLHDPRHVLVGHGLGASKESEGALETRSLANTSYPGVGIGLTGFSSLLWDVGVLGLSAIVAMFWWAYRVSGRLSQVFREDLRQQALFRGLQAAIPVVFLSLAHKNFFVLNLHYQTFVLGVLGFVAYWVRRVAQQEKSLSAVAASR